MSKLWSSIKQARRERERAEEKELVAWLRERQAQIKNEEIEGKEPQSLFIKCSFCHQEKEQKEIFPISVKYNDGSVGKEKICRDCQNNEYAIPDFCHNNRARIVVEGKEICPCAHCKDYCPYSQLSREKGGKL